MEFLNEIFKNMKLLNDKNVIVQYWGNDEKMEIIQDIQSVLQERDYKVNISSMSPIVIAEKIKTKELSPETILGANWMQIRNVVDVFETNPENIIEQISLEEREIFVPVLRKMITQFMNEGNQYIQLRLPSKENAEESGLTYEEYETIWENMIDIDYEKLTESCEKQCIKLQKAKKIQLVTSSQNQENYTLELELGKRKWFPDDGNGDFPAGEIYIAPIEMDANGHFIADKVLWNDRIYTEVVFEFKNGTLVECSISKILEDLKMIPGDSLKIGELGIGLNPGNSVVTGCTLFDEKIKGTCHIAVGANRMFGGNNDAPVHYDFISSNYRMEMIEE